jgi:nucleotidyltransferase/DNA polymerase involved in DNA repair
VRRPAEIERLYLDFDGFFASVEQQVHPHLRGKPVGVVPFKDAVHTCVIACSREAKLHGVKNVMNIEEASRALSRYHPGAAVARSLPPRSQHAAVGNLGRHPD